MWPEVEIVQHLDNPSDSLQIPFWPCQDQQSQVETNPQVKPFLSGLLNVLCLQQESEYRLIILIN